MSEYINILLKYNDGLLNVDTLKEHQEILKNKGKVVWGIIKPNSDSPGIAKEKIKLVNEQIQAGIKTYAFLCSSGKITMKANILKFMNSDEVKEMKEYVPLYYREKLDTCVAGVLIDFMYSADGDILKKLKRYKSKDEDIAVSTQTNPLYVSSRSSQEDLFSDEENINKIDYIKRGSWIIKKSEGENYIATKRVDSSTFGSGSVIPVNIREVFLNNISVQLEKGDKHRVNLICDDKVYGAKIDWVNHSEKNRKDTVIRIMFNDKRFAVLMVDKLNTSYNFIKKYQSENNNKTPKQFPEEAQEFIDFYKGDELDTFVVKLIDRSQIESSDDEMDEDEVETEVLGVSEADSIITDFNKVDVVRQIHKYISVKGYDYQESLIKNLYVSLKSKPFAILSGISGTGKSKIVELFAESIGATSENKRFRLVPVKPDWSDATDLLGYRNLKGEFTPGVITSIAYEAMMNPELPYFVCLDEMNLARVEYYFSDVLSIMETRKVNEDGVIVTNPLLSEEQVGGDKLAFDKYGDVYLPENLYIIGTVNMDETTFPFSKKVLDRANTIEFNKVDLSYSFEDRDSQVLEVNNYHNDFLKSNFLKLSECKEYKNTAIEIIDRLIKINKVLEEYNQHFGYRVRDEIVFYMIYATQENLLEFDYAFDMAVTQKILPKISGSSQDVMDLLIALFDELNDCKTQSTGYLEDSDIKEMKKNSIDKYKLTNEKIIYMIRRFMRDGFTTFWQ